MLFEHVFERHQRRGDRMRRYADPVEVRRGPLDAVPPGREAGLGTSGAAEGPQQFLWRGRLWKVRAVLAYWVETAPWWQSSGVRAVIGSEEAGAEESGVGSATGDRTAPRPVLGELLTERELWRVEAGRGRPGAERPAEGAGTGVFDLSFDWTDGRWTLVGCTD
jgi:hypothetical protein